MTPAKTFLTIESFVRFHKLLQDTSTIPFENLPYATYNTVMETTYNAHSAKCVKKVNEIL